ncbi:hypothetical protein Val02_25130 [Virgisporangium aliadipatigenens]|uniref:Uncharacterized protein n=1 Tax=Virgisporangium aliadipatigenens TaxID=741659 RepID=A0A8J4DQS5_9ACTN|nr:hypothetical protein [Virgisporangium aliadipatigenens]GIJ45627.1 hypothetical protein Val02_25130 [Virgisporangium aliadipatigenens]
MSEREPIEVGTPRPADLPSEPSSGARAAGQPWPRRVLGVLGRGWRSLAPRTRWILVATVVLSVLLVCGGYRFVQWVGYTPEKPVEELATALRGGDLDRAVRLVGCPGRLCQPGALAEGYQPPSGLTVVAVVGEMSEDTADVAVRYDLAGERRSGTIRVERPEGGPLGEWRIVAGATGAIDPVSETAKQMRVAAVTVPARRPSSARTQITVLFGVYTVAGEETDPLMSSAPAQVPVAGTLARGGTATVVQPALTVRDTAKAEVERQVRARLDACAAQQVFVPKVGGRTCPFEHSRGQLFEADSTQISWKVETYPTVELAVTRTPTAEAPPVSVRTAEGGKGRATVSYVYRGAPAPPVSVEFTVAGSVSVVDGKVVWSGA